MSLSTWLLTENHVIGGKLTRDCVRQPAVGPQRVEPADHPRIPPIERAHEIHELGVLRDVLAALLEIDGGPHHPSAADRDESGLEKRQRQRVAHVLRHVVVFDDALPVVVLDLGAMFAHQRLDLHVVEPAARDDQARRHVARQRLEGGDDAIDVGFDVDAGLILELGLPISGRRARRGGFSGGCRRS